VGEHLEGRTARVIQDEVLATTVAALLVMAAEEWATTLLEVCMVRDSTATAITAVVLVQDVQ